MTRKFDPPYRCHGCGVQADLMHGPLCVFGMDGKSRVTAPPPRPEVAITTPPAEPWPQPKQAELKPTNPKDAVGIRKAPLSSLPIRVLWRVGLAMMEGALKYGRHNYRAAGVRASVYFDAVGRHLFCWWEGEDLDPDTNLSHIDKAIAALMVLRDSMLEGNWEDDRPPRTALEMDALNKHAGDLLDRYAGRDVHHWTINDMKDKP